MMNVELPKDFFTTASMLTLSGATGATFVICNGLQRAFDFNPRWLALGVAEIIILAGVYASGGASGGHTLTDYLIGIINGFLVYCSAGGATGVLGNATQGGGAPGAVPAAQRENGRGFLTPWF